jgi:uncharacterized protein (DUF433 family)
MARGQPFNIRLEASTERLVDAEARRTNRSRSAVVEALTEEAARTRRFAGIAFRGDDSLRRPWLIGSGLDVWEVVQMLEEVGSAEALVRESQLTAAQVRTALAYRDSYPDEVREAIDENRRSLIELRDLYPLIEVVDG